MKFKKFMAILLSATTLFAVSPVTLAADTKDVDYTISNPYDGVDFDTYNVYKADLHSHTTFSDGKNTLPEMAERHYELGFDIYAVTDHSTTFYGYTSTNHVPAMKVMSIFRNKILCDDALSPAGIAANGNAYKIITSAAGDEYYSQTLESGKEGQQMLAVPYGNEQNGTSFNNAHVNTWFVDYGNGRLGGTSDYKSVISAIDSLGGVCVINHPGEYSDARDEIYTADAYNKDDAVYNYKIKKFEKLLLDYDACIGIDVNSKGDARTRFDRKLWDTMLQDLLPLGRNVFAIASTDAHNVDIVDSGYTMHYMTSNTSENLKKNLLNGEFFAASKYIGNYDELVTLRDELKALGTSDALAMATELDGIIEQSASEMANGGKGQKYHAPTDAASPLFTNVKVDDVNDTITLEAENALIVHWIANGKVIHVGNTIDLDDYSDEIGNYVRAEAYGVGGVVYTQPFALDYDGVPTNDDFGKFFDWGGIVSAICDTIIKVVVAILPVDALASFLAKVML